MGLFAVRNIDKDEEVTFDYQFERYGLVIVFLVDVCQFDVVWHNWLNICCGVGVAAKNICSTI